MSSIFPKWTNQLPNIALVIGLTKLSLVVGIIWVYFTPKFWEVGYMPTQPGGGFSHLVHAGKLGMDCRYCHTNVDESPEANIPPVSTCYGCHAPNRLNADLDGQITEKVAFIREAYESDESIEWRRVHKLPDYVRNFPHHVHVQAGVSCLSCHGNIARQEIVHQTESLSMGWCLDCHRDPTPHLVPPDKVTDMFWVENQLADRRAQREDGARLLEVLQQNQLHLLPENCGACHY